MGGSVDGRCAVKNAAQCVDLVSPSVSRETFVTVPCGGGSGRIDARVQIRRSRERHSLVTWDSADPRSGGRWLEAQCRPHLADRVLGEVSSQQGCMAPPDKLAIVDGVSRAGWEALERSRAAGRRSVTGLGRYTPSRARDSPWLGQLGQFSPPNRRGETRPNEGHSNRSDRRRAWMTTTGKRFTHPSKDAARGLPYGVAQSGEVVEPPPGRADDIPPRGTQVAVAWGVSKPAHRSACFT